MAIPKPTTTKKTAKKWTQAEIDALTRKRGYNFRVQLGRLHKQGLAMQAYLEKHPGPDVVIWCPTTFRGTPDLGDWSIIQDRTGKMIVGRDVPLAVGSIFKLNDLVIDKDKDRAIPMYALVVAQVSMKDAQALAGKQKLPRAKRYCYEVHCD